MSTSMPRISTFTQSHIPSTAPPIVWLADDFEKSEHYREEHDLGNGSPNRLQTLLNFHPDSSAEPVDYRPSCELLLQMIESMIQEKQLVRSKQSLFKANDLYASRRKEQFDWWCEEEAGLRKDIKSCADKIMELEASKQLGFLVCIFNIGMCAGSGVAGASWSASYSSVLIWSLLISCKIQTVLDFNKDWKECRYGNSNKGRELHG